MADLGTRAARPPSLLDRIASDLDALSPSFRAIGDFLLAHHAALQTMQIGDVASRCGTADSTVVRFARRFGHSGYPDLKLALLLESATAATRLTPGQPMHTAAQHLPATGGLEALLVPVDDAVHRLNSLKAVIRSTGFTNIAQKLRHASCFTLAYAGEYDRLVAMYLGDALEAAGKSVLLTDRHMPNARTRHEASGIVVAIQLEVAAADPAIQSAQVLSSGTPQLSLLGTQSPCAVGPDADPSVLWVPGPSLRHRAQIAMTLSEALVGALRFNWSARSTQGLPGAGADQALAQAPLTVTI